MEPLAAPRPLAGRRLLVVEDCPQTRRLYAAALVRAGADVTLDCNGTSAAKAAAVAAARGTPFDGVLMDLMLDASDGLESTARLRADGFGGPILAVTACWSPGLASDWLVAGCDACLPKPLSLNDLTAWFAARLDPPGAPGPRASRPALSMSVT